MIAERDLRRAKAEHARARQVRELLGAEEQTAEQGLGLPRARLDDALAAALRAPPEVLALLKAYRAAEARFAELRACVSVVASARGIPPGHEGLPTPKFAPFSGSPLDDTTDMADVAIWAEAIADLADDATAALPEI